ncbi:MAG: hypothetical protein NC926_00250 [Candidatus Omnitrophica bacterium]|nr:hypothetical protein [Candidatus Omnitrophota bacterium]
MSKERRILEEKKLYEKLIKINSNFVEALFQLSRIFLHFKNYKKVLELDKKITQLMNFDAVSYYNLACDYSMLGDIENSLKNLKIAIVLGFEDRKYIKKDPELENLRKNKKFEEINSFFKK